MINLSKLADAAKAASPAKPASDSPLTQLAQEKINRRAALRRIGMVGGMTVLGVLSIDDLARVAATKLEQNELTRGIAKDFRKAGVAFADTLEQTHSGGNTGIGSSEPSNPCRTQAGMNYSGCMGTAASEMSKAIGSVDPVAGIIGLISGIIDGSFDPNAVTGPIGNAVSDYNSAMDACKSTYDATLTACKSNPNSTPLPFDPTVCQDNVDKNLEDTLKGKLWSDPKGAADSLKDDLAACSDKFAPGSSGFSDCCKDASSSNALPNGGKAVSPLAVKVYLECSYMACDSGIGPDDPRNNCSLA